MWTTPRTLSPPRLPLLDEVYLAGQLRGSSPASVFGELDSRPPSSQQTPQLSFLAAGSSASFEVLGPSPFEEHWCLAPQALWCGA